MLTGDVAYDTEGAPEKPNNIAEPWLIFEQTLTFMIFETKKFLELIYLLVVGCVVALPQINNYY